MRNGHHMGLNLAIDRAAAEALCNRRGGPFGDLLQSLRSTRLDFVAQWRALAIRDGNVACAGGAAVFQVPTWRRGYAYDLDAYLRRPKRLHMEMHVLPQAHVHRIIARNGCRLLELREDGWAEGRTAATISNTFFVVRD